MDTNTEEMVPRSKLDAVYLERNMLACALAQMAVLAGLPAGRGFDDSPSKGWDEEWMRVVYVTLPDGQQVSWHMGPGTEMAWAALPKFEGEWDGTMLGREPEWPCEVSWEPATVAGEAQAAPVCDACNGSGYTNRPSGSHACWKCKPATPAPVAAGVWGNEAALFRAAEALRSEWNLHYPDAVRMARTALNAAAPTPAADTRTNEAWIARAEAKLAAKRKMEETQ